MTPVARGEMRCCCEEAETVVRIVYMLSETRDVGTKKAGV